MLRPLRLILPAEKLRSARILLLKITHLPHVVAIGAYERLRRRMDDRRRDEFSLAAAAPAGQRKNALNRYSRSKRLSTPVPHLLAAVNLKPNALLEDDSRPHNANASPPEASASANVDDLKAAVWHLTSQIESLTRKIEGLQHATAQ